MRLARLWDETAWGVGWCVTSAKSPVRVAFHGVPVACHSNGRYLLKLGVTTRDGRSARIDCVATNQLICARPAVVSTCDTSRVDQAGLAQPIDRRRVHNLQTHRPILPHHPQDAIGRWRASTPDPALPLRAAAHVSPQTGSSGGRAYSPWHTPSSPTRDHQSSEPGHDLWLPQ